MVTPLDEQPGIFSPSTPTGVSAGAWFFSTHDSISKLSAQDFAGLSADALKNNLFWLQDAETAISYAANLNLLDILYNEEKKIFDDTGAAQNALATGIATLDGSVSSTSNSTINGFNHTLATSSALANFQQTYNAWANALATLKNGTWSPQTQAGENAAIDAYNTAETNYSAAVAAYNSAKASINGAITTYTTTGGPLDTYNTAVTNINNEVATYNANGIPPSLPTIPTGPTLPQVTTTVSPIPSVDQTHIPHNTSSNPYKPNTYNNLVTPSPFVALPNPLTILSVPTNPYPTPSFGNFENFYFFIFYSFLTRTIIAQFFISGNVSGEIFNTVVNPAQTKGIVNRAAFSEPNQDTGGQTSATGGATASVAADDLSNPNLDVALSFAQFLDVFLNAPQQPQAVQSDEQRNPIDLLTIPIVIYGIKLLNKIAQVAELQAIQQIGGPSVLSQTSPNAGVADLFGSVGLAGALSEALNSPAAEEGFAALLGGLAQQLGLPQLQGAAGDSLQGKFATLLISLVLAKVAASINSPNLVNRILRVADDIAKGKSLPSIFKRLTQNNIIALIRSGPISAQFIPAITKALTGANINPAQAAALANRLTTQQIKSQAQLRQYISDALKASGQQATDEQISQVENGLTSVFGLSALQQSLVSVNAKAAQDLHGQFQSVDEFNTALNKTFGKDQAQEIQSQVSEAFAGNVLGLEFAPSAQQAFTSALTNPPAATVVQTPFGHAVSRSAVPGTPSAAPGTPTTPTTTPDPLLLSKQSTFVDDFLSSVFGFVPGRVPSNTSLFHQQIQVLHLNYTRSQAAQTSFEDHTAIAHQAFRTQTSGQTFVSDMILNPGNNIFATWSDFQPHRVPAFQERPLEFQA